MTTEQRTEQSVVATYIRFRPNIGGPWCYVEPRDLDDSLEGEPREDYQIEEIAMTHAEFEALPEFEGW